MDPRTPPTQTADSRSLPPGPGPHPNPCDDPTPEGGKILKLGRALIQTLRHFFPELNPWLAGIPDTRFQELVTYNARFLIWIALLAFVLRLSSRRRIDFDLRELESFLRANLNRLAQTHQETLPVGNTIDHFLEHTEGPEPFARLRQQCIHRLLRMRALDPFRLQGCLVLAVDGTGMLVFHQRHCPHCLTQKHGDTIIYFHPILEGKLVTPNGLALSAATEFIENYPQDPNDPDYEKIKQDCELKALARLAPTLKRDFPQLALILSYDSLGGCGPFFQICHDQHWHFVTVFKPGRTPALWEDVQGLLKLQPDQKLTEHLPDHTVCVYRWVEAVEYIDSENRHHCLNALFCDETAPDGQVTHYAWLTDLPLNRDTVMAVARHGGRIRSKIENQGFNVQKNSGLNLTHAYSLDWNKAKAYYYLMQTAHLFYQLLEKGSLLLALAREYQHSTPAGLWGGQELLAQRLLEALRNRLLPDGAFDLAQAAQLRVSLNNTS